MKALLITQLVMLAIASADAYSDCDTMFCMPGWSCRDVYDITTNTTEGQCMQNSTIPGIEDSCMIGNPLILRRASGGINQFFCGRGPNSMECPSDYMCNISAVDAYAFCCQAVKPGECPSPTQGGDFGICANTCDQDSDCSGDLKCCSNSCGGTVCQSPDFSNSLCHGVVCPVNQKCMVMVTTCINPPCQKRADCVDIEGGQCRAPPPGTFGICANTCSRDGDCDDNQKCCVNSCGATTCQTPMVSNGTCHGVVCPANQKCVVYLVSCIDPPCPKIPACIDSVESKPGQCPSPTQDGNDTGICSSTCNHDDDCNGNLKCCGNACGATVCQSPVASCDGVICPVNQECAILMLKCGGPPCGKKAVCTDIEGVKQGQCPSQNQAGSCDTLCSQDNDCSGKLKCCGTACGGSVCQTPIVNNGSCHGVICPANQKCGVLLVNCIDPPCPKIPDCIDEEEKPGMCPVPRTDEGGICSSTCSHDSDCNGDLKCCRKACGAMTCQTSLRYCDTESCPPGSTCRDVFSRTTQDIKPVCISNPHTDNEDTCSNRLPLVTSHSPWEVTEVDCGTGSNRMDCPSGFECFETIDDRHAVCCEVTSDSSQVTWTLTALLLNLLFALIVRI